MMSHHETARPNPGIAAPARRIFEYLCLRDRLPSRADVIVGFGHFDPKIPARCGELYRLGYASRLLFTGGIGAGTADLVQPEAIYFLEETRRRYPDIPERDIIVESESTHTGENVQYSLQRIEERGGVQGSGSGLQRVILVANAYRQRRVWLTWRHYAPGMEALNAPPETTFEDEWDLFKEKERDLIGLLVGEVYRILRYGARGFMIQVEVPEMILDAWSRLRYLGYGAEASQE
jgi:uncharacterized SAM-binding protein YcdF (DUF218 family)